MSPLSSSDLEAPDAGATIGPWLLLEWLDHGAFGMVYRARRADSPEAPPVALKLARSPYDERFEREANLLRRLQHPSIPRFEDEGLWTSPAGFTYPYLVMGLVQGFTLYDWVREARRSSREVLRVLAQVAQALAVTHASGALHRDVKGHNICVTAEGHAVLLDWGSGWFSGARSLTDNIVAPGTSAYRPPEQRHFMGKFFRDASRDAKDRWEASPSDDLYALGVAVYRAVTGRYLPPCTDGGRPVKRKVVPLREVATVCRELETLTMRLLSDKPAERGTAMQLAKEAQVAMETAGPLADRPILPTPPATPTEKEGQHSSEAESSDDLSESDGDSAGAGSDNSVEEERHRPRPRSAVISWLPPSLAAMVGALLGTYAATPRGPAPAEPEPAPVPVAEEWHAPEADAPDAGVGEEALASAEDFPRVGTPLDVVGWQMPKQPFPSQKKPPCNHRSEVEALGVCWVVLEVRPPCGSSGYEYQGRCILPNVPLGRQPASEDP